jgi:hypothetical protein
VEKKTKKNKKLTKIEAFLRIIASFGILPSCPFLLIWNESAQLECFCVVLPFSTAPAP